MSARESAAKYARALLDVAIQESDPARVGEGLSSFASLFAGNAELRDSLTHPAVASSMKQHVVSELADRLQLDPPVRKLLAMLAERDRLALLRDVVDVYQERLLEYQKVVRAEVTTAAPLAPERIDALRARLADATGRTIAMTTKVDPALIGGVVARVGSTVYDGSVATQLARLRDKLLQDM